MGGGLDLAQAFYAETVAPIVDAVVPPGQYAGARLGRGSEVLGLDDRRSTDHDWGARLQLFLADDLGPGALPALDAELERRLPATFRGRPVRFELTHDPIARHRVEVAARPAWFRRECGFDPLEPIGLAQWLAVPTWRLAELVAGRVFHDGPGELTRSRAALAWYPDDVWRWLLAAQWQRIAEEEAFPGRCVERGDLLGAAVITARLARDVMRLWLLMDRVHPPYDKWLGTAFARRPDAEPVLAELHHAVAAPAPDEQAARLGAALVQAARRQNELGLCAPAAATLRPFHDRPFLVIGAERFAGALLAAIADDRLRALPLTGVCDQYVDNVTALERREPIAAMTSALLALAEEGR